MSLDFPSPHAFLTAIGSCPSLDGTSREAIPVAPVHAFRRDSGLPIHSQGRALPAPRPWTPRRSMSPSHWRSPALCSAQPPAVARPSAPEHPPHTSGRSNCRRPALAAPGGPHCLLSGGVVSDSSVTRHPLSRPLVSRAACRWNSASGHRRCLPLRLLCVDDLPKAGRGYKRESRAHVFECSVSENLLCEL